LNPRGYHVMGRVTSENEAGHQGAAIDPGGLAHTGDLGAMDARGYCTSRGTVEGGT